MSLMTIIFIQVLLNYFKYTYLMRKKLDPDLNITGL